ncbi:L-type lectin family protein [Companilactobacillus kedongensis]|uniref:lectin-like domain-containing protein n=1 Tax=Companilactobacillus kedongensis TaxID=2486004 RepID=UPI000F781D98|nr:hypothetical protein [Companilactobacillus kedongensis]
MDTSKIKSKLLFILLSLFALITLIVSLNNYINVNAEVTDILPSETKPDDPEDLQKALDSAPRGMDISDPTFQQGIFSKPNSSDNMNASKVIKRSENDPDDHTRILRVTHGYYQLGSIWSNIDKSNYLDITKDQTMSMWLYFGHPKDTSKPLEVGDGMAFVLQNAQDDPKNINNPYGGIRAISRFKGVPAPGQTLGVWGADMDNDNPNNDPSTQILPTAIQNSFAIEFDTFLNKLNRYEDISGEGVSFDYVFRGDQISGQHINMDYPDVSATYFPFLSGSDQGTKYYYMMKHNNLYQKPSIDPSSGPLLTDAKWHHMTIKFDHATSTLTYFFNDKNVDGTANNKPITKSQKLDMDHFKLNGSNKLRWGFTGSTGKFMENNLIVFESIPSFVSADSTASIKDNTKNKVLTATDNHVNAGDDLSFIYNLTYINGSKDWDQILAKMNLPEQVTYTSGTVTYADGSHEDIPLTQYNKSQILHVLSKALSNNMQTAKIELHATANMVDKATNVPSTHVKFESDNFIIDDDNQAFVIDVPKMMINSDPSGVVEYSSMDQVPDQIPIKGEIWYSNGDWITPSNVELHSEINTYTNNFHLSGYNGSKASYSFYVPKSQLIKGQNILTLYATDNNGYRTSNIKIIFKVAGNLEFGQVGKNVYFENIKKSYPGEIVPRQSGWQVEVIDGRDPGLGWTLQAHATVLKDNVNNQILNGNMVYRSTEGKIFPLTGLQEVYRNIKNQDDVQTIDVASQWTKDSGILLKLDKDNPAGIYSGTISWSLVDGIPNI